MLRQMAAATLGHVARLVLSWIVVVGGVWGVVGVDPVGLRVEVILPFAGCRETCQRHV